MTHHEPTRRALIAATAAAPLAAIPALALAAGASDAAIIRDSEALIAI